MIKMQHKPNTLPQLSAPFNIIVDELNKNDIEYEELAVNPSILNPIQGIVYSNNVSDVDLNKPIWTDDSMNILDGHHRFAKALISDDPINIIKINLNQEEACRILNKIQDIYDYQESIIIDDESNDDIESDSNEFSDEIETNSNDMNIEINEPIEEKEFLIKLEEDNQNLLSDGNSKLNKQTVTAYRKNPINEESVIGNFFSVDAIDGYDKYEIDFDNLLDINKLGISIKNGQQPVDVLAKIWYPHVNFEELSKTYDMKPIDLKSKAISERAMKCGYDGIKYGKLLQGFK